MFSDAHTHVSGSPLYPDFGEAPLTDEDFEKLVVEARRKAVVLIVAASHDLASAERTIDMASRATEVYAALGMHPWVATTIDDEGYRRFLALAERPKVVGLSEIGLDNVRSKVPKETQVQALTQMFRLSSETGLPVMLHDRGYHKELIRLVQSARPAGGCIHGFDGSESEVEDWLQMGYYVSIGRVVVGTEGERLRTVVRKVPIDKLLLETDSPGRDGKGVLNGQARVLQVAEIVAGWLGLSAEAIGEATTDNLRRMLKI